MTVTIIAELEPPVVADEDAAPVDPDPVTADDDDDDDEPSDVDEIAANADAEVVDEDAVALRLAGPTRTVRSA